ncbi:MAG TPA: YbhB/YbcL family Raf kinase inhibitor-like protein [Candidatus Dormibacteraeota bacterium]|nr:YbhB/YbcL family Raf kinase inhibitor-like protein [Candidatus Dormibacteraeota bacterium]
MSTAPFSLSSSAFAAGSAIPRQFTCDGPDVSPPLAWSGAPAGTNAFLLVVDDPDANGFVHWVAIDLPGTTASMAQGASGHLAPATEGRNGFGRIGWGGPCPPSGTHHYRFSLTALSAPLGLPPGSTAAQARAAASGKSLGQAQLVATYHR